MTREEVGQVERELGVQLPQDYRDVLLGSDDLRALTHVLGDRVYPVFQDSLYLEPDELIFVNRCERNSDAATEYVFPGWWKEYILIGSNGAGDYFCVCVDGRPGVWFLCNASGKVHHCYGTVHEYVLMRLEQYYIEQAGGSQN